MVKIIRQLYEGNFDETFSLVVLNKSCVNAPMTEGFDMVILHINNQKDVNWQVMHYVVEDKRISFHTINKHLLNDILITGNYKRVIDWIVNGEIVFDRNGFLKGVKERIKSYPLHNRRKEVAIQFTKLLRSYEEGKVHFLKKNYFDSYSSMVSALHYLAHLAVIQRGYFPRSTIWEQVHQIEPQIFKLYQELLKSEETLEQRIELLIIALEFAIHSKAEVGCQHFLTLLSEDFFSIDDIMKTKDVEGYWADLELLILYLVERGFLTSTITPTKVNGVTKIDYEIKNIF